MSINTYKWAKAVGHAWLWWSQADSPLFDPEKATRLADRREATIHKALVRMNLSELSPVTQEVTE